ncbi:hypothetical protein SALBM135S_02626 [Streptomyces alboniger]
MGAQVGVGRLGGVEGRARREDRALPYRVQELPADEDEGPLTGDVDPPYVGLHHGGEALVVHPGDVGEGGVALIGTVTGGIARSCPEGRLDDELTVTGGQLGGPARLGVARRHGGDARRGQLAQVPLVGVPPHDTGRVGEPRELRAPLGPRHVLLGAPAVVPGRPDHRQVEGRPVGLRVVPADDTDVGVRLGEGPCEDRQVVVVVRLGASGHERDAGACHGRTPLALPVHPYVRSCVRGFDLAG